MLYSPYKKKSIPSGKSDYSRIPISAIHSRKAAKHSRMYKVTLALALLLAVAAARPQFGTFGGNRPFGQPGFGFPAFGGTGSGAGAGTGNAGPGGVSASGVGISSAQNGGVGTGSGTGTANLNLFTGQAGATGQGSGSSIGK